jgi:hypothetical protein
LGRAGCAGLVRHDGEGLRSPEDTAAPYAAGTDRESLHPYLMKVIYSSFHDRKESHKRIG